MKTRPKDIGTTAETAVVKACRGRGFPGAERRALRGRADAGDVLLAPGVILEVKAGQAARAASDAQIRAWLTQTEAERANAGAAVGILVTTRAGIGPRNAHRWWAHLTLTQLAHLGAWPTDIPTAGDHPLRMTLDSALALLRAAGYGTPLDRNGAAR